jgi:hypothetical protein
MLDSLVRRNGENRPMVQRIFRHLVGRGAARRSEQLGGCNEGWEDLRKGRKKMEERFVGRLKCKWGVGFTNVEGFSEAVRQPQPLDQVTV